MVAVAGDDLVACRSKDQIHVRKDNWTRISAPPVDVGEGPRTVVDYTAAPFAPNRLYSTNGVVIKNSADGGCTWNFLYGGSNVRLPGGGGQQEPDIFTNLSASNDTTMWVASYDDTAGVAHPHVRLFTGLGPADPQPPPPPVQIETGLPQVGKPLELIANGIGVVYLLVEEPPDPRTGDLQTPVNRLYTTHSPGYPEPLGSTVGLVWKEVTPPTGFGSIQGFAVGSGRQVWIWNDGKYATTPAADVEEEVWFERPTPGGKITSIDVNSAGFALVTSDAGQGAVRAQVADRAGKVLGKPTLPVLPTSMTHGDRPDVRVLSGPRGTWGYDMRLRKWIDITPKGVGPLSSLSMANGRVQRIVLGHVKDAIFRFDTYTGETFVPIKDGYFGGDWPDLPYSDIKKPYLDVEPGTVTVRPGELKDADIEFGMPPSATPLDVFFLVDTTGSMQGAINGLRKDIGAIASKMRTELGRDACFGVGDFKDFTALEAANVFRTHQPIVCETDKTLPKVNQALKQLSASAGGDDPEAQTIALTQMVTGSGQTNPFVRPGQQAAFRDEAYKIVVLISDAPFKSGPGYPDIETTARTLKVNGIKVVSVLVINNLDPALGRADMTELANQTDSFAPLGGVDCDGDGQPSPTDLREGDPLICETNGSEPNIGPVIVALLLGVEDPGTVAVDVDDPGRVIREPIQGSTSKILNLKRVAKLPFVLPVSCTKEQDGKDFRVSMTPTVRALPVPEVSGTLVVRCRSVIPPKVVQPPEPPQLPEPPPILDTPIPPLRQPVALALVPPPNPPVQPISNMNLNAGFSQQEEQQMQLATVSQGASEETQEDEEPELAMMGLELPERAVPAGAFIAGAAAITAAAALAHRRRLQRANNTSYVRAGRF